MKYSRIYAPVLFSYFFILILLLFNNNFNINNFENINHLYKYLLNEVNIFYIVLFVSLTAVLVSSLSYILYKHLNLLFFSISNLIIILPLIFIYSYLKNYKAFNFNFELLIYYSLLCFFSYIVYELLFRSYIKSKAKNIFFGSELNALSKLFFIDKKIKDDFIIVYFYIPHFYEILYRVNSIKEANNYINKIKTITHKILNKYNAILINNSFNSYTYALKKHYLNKNKSQDYAYLGVLSALDLQNSFKNLNVNNYLLKELNLKFIISTSLNTKAFYDFKDKKYIILSDVFTNFDKLSNYKENNIIIDEHTYKLIANYFTTKDIQHNLHAVLGISTY